MKLTREQIERYKQEDGATSVCGKDPFVQALCDMALSSLSAEPVAFIHPLDIGRRCETTPFRESDEQVKLYTAPPDADKERLREALKNLLTMLPSDHPERPDTERIPASYCYVRWLDIREGRAALKETK